MTTSGDLGQFLVAHQDQVFTDLLREQPRSQEDMLKTLCGQWQKAAPGPAGAGAVVPAGANYFCLAKLMAEDDVESFLSASETTAAAAAWPLAKWVPILGPYLMGPAQVVFHTMPAVGALNYDRVKLATLDRYEGSEETHQARFQSLCHKAGDHPPK